MKKTIIILSLVVFFGWVWGAMEKQPDKDSFEKYLSVQQALAGDDFLKAKDAAHELLSISKGKLKDLVVIASKADNIKALRTAFKSLSEWFIKRGVPSEHVLVFCPMAENNTGAYWIQVKDKITNPYLGLAMLRCGTIKESMDK